jgi:8-oxo-dGTP pyrophosphatase MutT (NUDIX family)
MSIVKRAVTNALGTGDEAEKALSPAQAGAPEYTGVSGATYPVLNPSSPFNQTGGSYGANPLPRPNTDFGSLFGPGYPLFPDALDPLGPSGRAEPRRYQYRVTENIAIGQFGAPWTLLRQIASDVDVVSRCIQLVQDAIGGMQWSFGFSRQIINQIRLENDEPNSARATAIARDKYGDELTRTQKFWERPDERMSYTFSQWLNLAVWSSLTYDGIVVTPGYTLGGDLHSLSLLDTSTVKILLDNQGFLPQPPAPAYQQILYGFPRSEFQAEDIDEFGNIPNGYRSDQLSYYIQRPRLHTPYGFSTVEECINIATLYQQRQEWMRSEWSHGVTPKGVIKTTGTEGWTPEQFAYFQQSTNDQWSGQTQRRQQVMVLRPGMEWEQLKDFAELYKTDFEEWCVLQIGAKFGVPQQQLGIPQHSFARSGAQNQTSMDLADRYAIDALVNHLINCINDLTRRYMGTGPEITITATSGNSDDSDYQRAQADASDVNNAIRTTNEIRAERGLPLISDKEADVLRATAGNAVIFFPGQLAYQEATERAVLEGTLAAADPDVATPSQADQNKPPTANADDNTPAAPKSKSNTAETNNRSVGHVTTGSDMVTPGTDRKARASRAPSTGAPQPSSDSGSYAEKELRAFAKFSKARIAKGTWRDFEFIHVGDDTAASLNDAGRASVVKTIGPVASGVCVRAANSGRVLMLQRTTEDDNDPAAGKWEFPGGCIEDGETPYEAACREWTEETGCSLPNGTVLTDWLSPNGVYKLYVMEVQDEADVAINLSQDAGRAFNPDDPDSDCPEVAAWFDVSDLPGNSALRSEVALTDWNLIARATS